MEQVPRTEPRHNDAVIVPTTNTIELEDWIHCGAFVLAKFGEMPHWPGMVTPCRDGGQWQRINNQGESEFWVHFVNDYLAEWIPHSRLAEFSSSNVKTLCVEKVPDFDTGYRLRGALDEAQDRCREIVRRQILERGYVPEPQLGDVVLARLDAYPPWPAVVEPCSTLAGSNNGPWRLPNDGGMVHCRFLTSGEENWVPIRDCRIYSKESKSQSRVRANNKLYEDYCEAIKAADRIVAEKEKPSASSPLPASPRRTANP